MDTLRESIQSVLDQTTPPDRFVVIDNASTDASRQIAVDMGVEVVDADNKYKFITGLNTAIKLNQDLLFFMQNDVVLDKKCLEAITYSECATKNFIAQPLILSPDGEIDNSGMDYWWPGFGIRRKDDWFSGNQHERCGLVTTICFLTDNKNVFYDERFSPAYMEDIDFYLRTNNGRRIEKMYHDLCPYAIATHLGNHTFSQTYKKKEISRICWINRNKLIRKHFQGTDKWLRLAVSTGGYIVAKAFNVIREWRVSKNDRH